MMNLTRVSFVLTAFALVGGCSSSDSTGPSTTTTDAGPDSGLAPKDSGADTGTTDSGTRTTDSGATGDAATATATVNGCSLDATTFKSGTAIAFGDAVGLAYSPPCLTAPVGATVTFNGAFASHPLVAGVAPKAAADSTVPPSEMPTSPIKDTNNGMTATFTFATAGVYPFYCSFHQSSGMYGAIWIK